MSQSTGAQYPVDPVDPLAPGPVGTTTTVGTGASAGTGRAGRSSGQGSGQGGTADVAKEQAAAVGQEAKQSGQHVAGVAKEEASNVAAEAGRQARDLLHQGRTEVSSQLTTQQQRAAGGLRSIGDELRDLAEGRGGSNGVVTDLAHQASQRVSTIASWLEEREPADLLQEVQSFARRRPGTFLAVAAGVGVLAGRLTRGFTAAAHQGGSGTTSGTAQGTYRVSTPGRVETTYTGTTGTTGTGYDDGYGTGTTGTVYPTGTTAHGTDPLSTSGTEVFEQPGGRVQP